ncbi:MAG: hypothetical protein NTX91_01160 [candidate division SR1 bacterium]|nr:hypothetical protein [candidate division SR1 bacterium]
MIALTIPSIENMKELDPKTIREIVISIKDNLKELFLKLYSPSCMPFNPGGNREKYSSSEKISQEPMKSEEDEEIKKLEEQIQKIKQKKKLMEDITRKQQELQNDKLALKDKKRVLAELETQLRDIK